MNGNLLKNADASYRKAELEATNYFKSLLEVLEKKTYVSNLTNDFQVWKQHHIHRTSLFSFLTRKGRKPSSKEYQSYIQWLDYTGKLEQYLDRSISYIFMRDLGKALYEPTTQARIRRDVDRLQTYLTSNLGEESETFSLAGLYRLAEKEGVESSLFWLIDKLKKVSSHIPERMDAEEAKRKLIKIIAGVVMQVIEETDENSGSMDRKQRLEEAIRLGYSYGLTYPFIDDLLDSDVLSMEERTQYSVLIRTTLLTGSVPELGEWRGKNKNLIQYIHSELGEAFEYIKTQQRQETWTAFLEQSYVFFESQEVDRNKDLSNENYTNEELYIPVILKSASSRLIVRSLIDASEDEGIDHRTFYYGIYNQLADDFTDMFDDLKQERVTPYTYYITYHDKRPDLINPFELYWTVISYLIHHVYHADSKTREVILNRAINGLKRYKGRMGETYHEVMEILATDNLAFNQLIQRVVNKADDVDFFDKLVRDHIIGILKEESKERNEFLETVKLYRSQLNNHLVIPKNEKDSLSNDPILDAANYSLESNGKRLRPIITWMMGQEFGLDQQVILPLLKSLEYMHTASLIYDDLPGQDDADVRRGRPTVHQQYNTAIAELTGLFLTQKAVEQQASLSKFDSKNVLSLIQYSAQMTAAMCRGQAMDLDSKGKNLTLEQLHTMCFYKTAIGFEASLVMPAILVNTEEFKIEALKKFSYHSGIAFQIKDDLLDVEGEYDLLGKPLGKDIDNNRSTFVSILGVEEARKAMWENYCLAMEALQKVPLNISFLKHLLNFMVNRDH